MRKIILYVTSMVPAGGIERVVSTLANELSKDNQVTILVKGSCKSFYSLNDSICVDSIDTYRELNMNSRFKRMFALLLSFFLSIYKLRNFLSKEEFEYIYVTTPLSFWEVFFTFKMKNKIIASEHGARQNYNFIYKILKNGYKMAAAYLIPTKNDYNYYFDKGYPAIYMPHLRPELHYQTTDFTQKTVINIGRFTADKRQLLLLDIWSDVLRENKVLNDWVLILVGTGELEDDILRKIRDLGLSGNVKVYPPQNDIENFYLSASIFALTSRSEGFGMVLLEALSFGLALLSFDCPSGPRDIISNNIDGFLIDDNDVLEYKHSLIKLMLNDVLREGMSKSGFKKGNSWNQSLMLKGVL